MWSANDKEQTGVRSAKIFNSENLRLSSPVQPRKKGLGGGVGVDYDDFLRKKLCLPIDP